ncbi:serine/threonine kinase [Aureococcus anophagefferens]|nr:serine/threonine kinase [Aureococcus anophagefferens]
MVYVSGDGAIYRARSPRSRWKETGDRIASTVQWQLHSLLAVLVIAIAAAMCSVPTVQDLREHRVREDGLWFAPAIDKHRSLGVCAVAEVAVGGKPTWHVGAYGAWVALRGGALLRGAAADDATLLVALVVAGFALHAPGLPSRGWLRRHCAASAANARSGRVWCLVLAALAHEDALHLSMNGLAPARAPLLMERLGTGRRSGRSSAPPRPRARARPSSSTRSSAATRRRAARRASSSPCSPSRPRAATTAFYGVPGLEMPASTAMLCSLALDALVRRRSGVDFAAHLGGAAFGAASTTGAQRRRGRALRFAPRRC